MPDNLITIFYDLIITFGLLLIVCYIIELVSWMREESQSKWVRNTPLILFAGLIIFGLVAWTGIINILFGVMFIALFLSIPKGYGRWRGGSPNEIAEPSFYVFLGTAIILFIIHFVTN